MRTMLIIVTLLIGFSAYNNLRTVMEHTPSQIDQLRMVMGQGVE